MRIVMPSLVPHTPEQPFLSMARFECGDGSGNPHFHGFVVGAGNPKLGRVRGDVTAEGGADEMPGTPSSSDAESLQAVADEQAGVEADPQEVPADLPVAEVSSACAADDEVPPVTPRGKSRGPLSKGRAAEPMAVDESSPVPDSGARGVSTGSGARRVLCQNPSAASAGLPDNFREATKHVEAQSVKEREFHDYFGPLVSEWNPCRDDHGSYRFFWDEEVGAHDVEVAAPEEGASPSAERRFPQPRAPERCRLREVLGSVMGDAERGRPLDLTPLRRLLAKLVETSCRHTSHGVDPPKMGVHACARKGVDGFPYCRYGFPKEWQSRLASRKMHLVRGEREGQWNASFPRNDRLCCSYEAHFLMSNLGNIDWRPCMNLWAVTEYISKYATKAPTGSRRLGEVLGAAAGEVCKYADESEGGDLLRQTLLKVFSKTLGSRDYSTFEAVYLGLGLPLVLELMPTVSVNTYGTRSVRPESVIRADPEGVHARLTYDSKLDQFDHRRQLWRKQFKGFKGKPEIEEGELRALSFYEYCWKYRVTRGKLQSTLSDRPVALTVTPQMSADSADVSSPRHEVFARSCVIAYWRLLTRQEHLGLYNSALAEGYIVAVDQVELGGTVFEEPLLPAGFPLNARFLGCVDLVGKFDGAPSCWGLALMEMLVDPVLCGWVPAPVVEQYERQNPHFRASLRAVLRRKIPKEGGRVLRPPSTNRKLLLLARSLMKRRAERASQKLAAAASEGSSAESGLDGAVEDCSGESDDNPDVAAAAAAEALGAPEMDREERPSFADGAAADDAVVGDVWASATAAHRVSAAGPASAAPDVVIGGGAAGAGLGAAAGEDALVNPTGYDWYAENLVPLGVAAAWEKSCKDWFRSDVAVQTHAPDLQALDNWQRFLHDIVLYKHDERERLIQQHRLDLFKPLRCVSKGGPGSGKSRTARAIVGSVHAALKSKGASSEEIQKSCTLAAPTGTGAFQMRNGATTAHRAFGIGVGAFYKVKPSVEQRASMDRQRRLQFSRLFMLDERSMFGRMFVGKIMQRVVDYLGVRPPGWPIDVSFGGRNLVLIGDDDQADPIGDEVFYKSGAYVKERKHIADGKGEQVPHADLVNMSEILKKELDDVVILKEAHRVDDGVKGMSEEELARYREECDRFWSVLGGMAKCTWSREDHAWLAQRNKSALMATASGRQQLLAFEGAPVLMDGRRRNAKGEDGADQQNAADIRRHAVQHKTPIASLRALHHVPTDSNLDGSKLDAEDFQGLQSSLELCVAARVMLIHNLWTPAGLTNGAMGYVRGFVWPQGGNPAAAASTLRVPLCVVVEFDELNMGERSFFPGVPSRSKWVPIFLQSVNSTSERDVRREGFPLVLAWSFTYWKAQGMTLRRARVRLTAKTAAMAGIGLVACSRVRHPRDIVFDFELPDWDVFQRQRDSARFRWRQRWSLRLDAKFSRTIRKYGFLGLPAGDPTHLWTPRDRERATELVGKLSVAMLRQRSSLAGTGMPVGEDAHIWPEGEPDLRSKLEEAVLLVAADSQCGQEDIGAFREVADRLMHELHVPALREALGCLIPAALHPRLDGRKPKAVAGEVAVERVTECLRMGKWQVSGNEEAALQAQARCLPKGLMDFFLLAAQRVCSKLNLSLAIGTSTLGVHAASCKDGPDLREILQGWSSWSREDVARVQALRMPVPVDGKKECQRWLLVSIRASDASDALGAGAMRRRGLSVEIFDHAGRRAMGERAARHMAHALAESAPDCESEVVSAISDGAFPVCPNPSADSRFAVLGLVFTEIARLAGEPFLDIRGESFASEARAGLARVFAAMRAFADKKGNRDVSLGLQEATECRALLRVLALQPGSTDASPPVSAAAAAGTVPSGPLPVAPVQAVRIVTWNIAGDDLAAAADGTSWSVEDKVKSLKSELARLSPDVLALQEVPSQAVSRACPPGLRFACAAESHHGCLRVYVRPSVQYEVVSLPGDFPGVLIRIVLPGRSLALAALHLQPHKDGREQRAHQLRSVLRSMCADALLLIGDMNVRGSESCELCKEHSLKDTVYTGPSWQPKKNRFYANLADYHGYASSSTVPGTAGRSGRCATWSARQVSSSRERISTTRTTSAFSYSRTYTLPMTSGRARRPAVAGFSWQIYAQLQLRKSVF